MGRGVGGGGGRGGVGVGGGGEQEIRPVRAAPGKDHGMKYRVMTVVIGLIRYYGYFQLFCSSLVRYVLLHCSAYENDSFLPQDDLKDNKIRPKGKKYTQTSHHFIFFLYCTGNVFFFQTSAV